MTRPDTNLQADDGDGEGDAAVEIHLGDTCRGVGRAVEVMQPDCGRVTSNSHAVGGRAEALVQTTAIPRTTRRGEI